MRGIEKNLGASQSMIMPEQVFSRSKGDTTPTVTNNGFLIFQNTGALTVTDFIGANNQHVLHVLGDGFTTISHGSRIKNASGANKLLAANVVYIYVYFNTVWYGVGAT